MLIQSSRLAAVALVLLVAAPASADWYESKKDERSGMIVGLASGGAVVVGLGELDDVTALGPGFSFRIGTVASPKLLWLLTLDSANYLVKDFISGEIKTNMTYTITLGGQYYVRKALWARLGAGIGGFNRRARALQKPTGSSSGLGFTSGLGVDVWFSRKWVVNLEGVFSGVRVQGGFVAHAGLMLALTRY